jgi:hypothetical protein
MTTPAKAEAAATRPVCLRNSRRELDFGAGFMVRFLKEKRHGK